MPTPRREPTRGRRPGACAGAGLAALAALEQQGDAIAFVPVRPPGHHATRDRAMGFCLLNNVAVAAAARTVLGERVLIVDWDVHHGNGTQDIFWDDPAVLYVSTHQHPLYPGTGRPDEVGGAAALGLTVNLPLPPGATGDVVRAALDEEARATIEAFRPDWVLVSCGFDAHRDDPLSNLQLSSGDFAELARIVRDFVPLCRGVSRSSSKEGTTRPHWPRRWRRHSAPSSDVRRIRRRRRRVGPGWQSCASVRRRAQRAIDALRT